MRALRALALCGAAGICGAQPQSQSTGAETIRTVHGVVVNSVTGAPIGRALITTGDQKMAQMTDAEGRFAFEVKAVAAGQSPQVSGYMQSGAGSFQSFGNASVYLMARKPGFRPSEQASVVSLTDAAALDGTVRVPLLPEGILAGHLVTDKAEPPVGVQVQLMQRRVEEGRNVWRAMQYKQTDARGDYRFADLAAGDYKVLTREWTERGRGVPASEEPKVGYPPVGYPNGTNIATAALLHVAAGETVQADMNLRAVPYYPVEIAVANSNGMGLGVQVEDGEGGSGFSLGYDQRKQTVAGSLPAGSYRLLLNAYSDRPMMATASLTVAGPVKGGGLTLAPGPEMRVEVREEFTASAKDQTGTVFGGISSVGSPNDGPPPAPRSVEVYLQPIGGEQRSGASLRNAGGRKLLANNGMVVENIQPGSYWVKVQPSKGYVASATVNGLDVLRRPLVVAAGSGVPPLELTLRDDFAKLTGTVTKASAASTSANGGYTTVMCFPLGEGSAEPVPGFVDPQAGQLQIQSLPPGRYLVVASEARQMQNLAWREEETMKRLMAKGQVVILPPGGTTSVNLTVVKGEPE